MEQTFGTTCHGAGRAMSRTAAVKHAAGPPHRPGAGARAASSPAPGAGRAWPKSSPTAYKDVDQVVDVVHHAGLSRKVARMRPIGVIKG